MLPAHVIRFHSFRSILILSSDFDSWGSKSNLSPSSIARASCDVFLSLESAVALFGISYLSAFGGSLRISHRSLCRTMPRCVCRLSAVNKRAAQSYANRWFREMNHNRSKFEFKLRARERKTRKTAKKNRKKRRKNKCRTFLCSSSTRNAPVRWMACFVCIQSSASQPIAADNSENCKHIEILRGWFV